MKLSRSALIAGGLLSSISMTNTARAAFVMTIDDLGTTGVDVVLSDGLGVGASTDSGLITTAADSGIGQDGFISFNGGVGSFVVNVVTGVSDPLIGPGQLDLNSINVSGAAGSLRVGLTDTDYTGSVSSYTANFGGTTTGSVSFDFLHDSANGEFGGTSFFSASGSGGAFSGSGGGAVGAGSPYSLTVIADIVHGVSGDTTSFDAHLIPQAIPVPAAVWLFGSGMLALLGVSRSRKTA